MSFEKDDKTEYLLNFLDYSIGKYIDDIMEDSQEDPEFSAVTLNNLILCYIHFLNRIEKDSVQTVREVFELHGYTEDEFLSFEKKRIKEAEYYNGVQY